MKTLLKTKSLNYDQITGKFNLKSKNLFFNLINRVFKMNSFDNKILDNDEITALMTIFSKKGEKTEEEMDLIHTYLNSIDFFSKLDIDDQKTMEKCINAFRLKGYTQGEIILNEDEEGNSLILVLYGIVSRYTITPYTGYMLAKDYINYVYKVKNEEKNENKYRRLEEYNKSKDDMIKIRLLQSLNYDLKKVTYDVNFYGEFQIETSFKTKSFKSKEMIGDKNLLNKHMNNELSYLIAENDCVVIILDKKDYTKIIEEMNNSKINNLSKKLKENFPIFKNWNRLQVSKLIYNLKKIVLKKDQILYTQNSPPDYIYFTFHGKLESFVTLDIKQHNDFCDFIYSKNDTIMSQLKKIPLDKDSEFLTKLKSEIKYFTNHKKSLSSLKNNRISTRNVKEDMYLHFKQREDEINQKLGFCQFKLSVIENYDIIGIEECIENKARFSTVKVLSQEAILYKIPIEDFLIIMNLKDTPILQISLLVKERKGNLIKIIKKAFDSKNDTINRRIITELSSYVNKSRDMKERNEERLFSPIFTVKTLESSNTLTQSIESIKKKVKSKQSSNNFLRSDNSFKYNFLPEKKNDMSNVMIESSFRMSTKLQKENKYQIKKQLTINDKSKKNGIWKDIGFYHMIKQDSKDEFALINLNHFVSLTDDPNKSIYPKRPFSCTIKKMKSIFIQKKQNSLKENSEVFKTFLPEKINSSYKRGYLVSRQQSKYFKIKKKL